MATGAVPGLAHAEDCRLQEIASVEMAYAEDNILIPVSIEGTLKKMIIDTASPSSALDPKVANDLHLSIQRLSHGYFTSAGEQVQMEATIHALDIGMLHSSGGTFFVWPSRMWSDDSIAGTLGAGVMRHYDVDLDFAAHKLNLFSQDHCAGQVVYWTTSPVTVVPMHVVQSGRIIVPVTLDGHDLNALFATREPATVLSLESAENYYGLKPGSPELSQASKEGVEIPFYQHVFKTLVLGGVTISNPKVYVRKHIIHHGAGGGVTDLILGMHELQHLHIYIAYKEQKFYISAAASSVAQAPAAPVSPQADNANPSTTAH